MILFKIHGVHFSQMMIIKNDKIQIKELAAGVVYTPTLYISNVYPRQINEINFALVLTYNN